MTLTSTAVACSASPGILPAYRQSSTATSGSFDRISPPGARNSEDESSLDPSAPPLSRSGSAASWAYGRRRRTFLTTPEGSQRCLSQGIVTPSPPPKDGRPKFTPEQVSIPVRSSTQPVEEQPADNTKKPSIPCRKHSTVKLHRPIMARHDRDVIRLQATLSPRDARVDGVGGCCGLCRAPSSMPYCAYLLPCCSYPEDLEVARRDSSYLVIRDNSVEFNNPRVVMGPRPATARGSMTTTEARGDGLRSRRGTYFGACGCTYHIRDDARVLYFDDPVLDDVMAITDTPCSRVRRCLCGGRGQAVRVQSRVCSGACVRARGLAGLPCMPTCCTCLCGSAAVSYDMPAKDAVDAMAKIARARDNALTRMRRDHDAHTAVPYVRSCHPTAG